MKLIDKDALVAEINQRIEDYKSHKIDNPYYDGLIFALEDLRDDFLDSLGVKEVDLEKEFDKYCENYIFDDECEVYTARHFFELGLKARKQ